MSSKKTAVPKREEEIVRLRKPHTSKRTYSVHREILIATRNSGKVREIREALRGLRFRILSLDDFPGAPAVEEDGKSFAENALKKARFYSKRLDKVTIADDSGLVVEALNGSPGIFSARYAGPGASDRTNNRKLLEEMEGLKGSRRKARFQCSLAVVAPGGKEAVVEGSCRGVIGFKEVGRKGFGYDPLFVLPRYGRTMAQLTIKEKNRISHRGKALKKLREVLGQFLR
jgi:XTP/dITP diphosphohydrolase